MSEGIGRDIHTIRNIAILFCVIVVVSMLFTVGTTVYGIYKARTDGEEA